MVRQHPLSGFEHCHFVGKLINAPCGNSNTPGSNDLYIDQSNYAEVISGIQRDEPIVTVAYYTLQIIGICDRNFGNSHPKLSEFWLSIVQVGHRFH
ncbi:hypothetical protein [Nostoc sp.]|uniref:hypothetical protein n=1 Tax=Nostoc sp. TaxID=1180 RepID=UPI002FF8AE20